MNFRLHGGMAQGRLAGVYGDPSTGNPGKLGLKREADQQQVADRMNVLFECRDCLEKQVGYRLTVYLHEVGDLLIVQAFEIFEKNSLLLAAG